MENNKNNNVENNSNEDMKKDLGQENVECNSMDINVTEMDSAYIDNTDSFQTDQKKVGILEYFSDLFFDPVNLGKNIKNEPKILAPLLVVMAISVLSILISSKMMMQFLQDTYMQFGMPTELIQSQARIAYYSSLGVATIGVFFVSLIQSGALLLVIKAFKGTNNFKTVFSLILFAGIITALGGFVASIGKLLTGNLWFELSPKMFINSGGASTWYGSLLGVLNPFVLWQYYIMYVVIRASNPFDNKTAAKSVIGYIILGFAFMLIVFLVTLNPMFRMPNL